MQKFVTYKKSITKNKCITAISSYTKKVQLEMIDEFDGFVYNYSFEVGVYHKFVHE